MNEDKYLYFKTKTSRQLPYLLKWTKKYSIEVEEEVDFRQYISLSIFRLSQEEKKPYISKYEKVISVIKETFLDHYNLALKYIHELNTNEGEFYVLKHSKDWFEIQYFSKDEKEKWSIKIDFREEIEDLWLTLSSIPGHKDRANIRKKGTAIANERFRQFLNLTIEFLYDPNSLILFLEDYIKNFRLLFEGENKMEGLIVSVSKSFEQIVNQLQSRTQNIEKRLIENDSDSKINRAKLRGELEGINYALKVINMYK
jgi:hypothetical protein